MFSRRVFLGFVILIFSIVFFIVGYLFGKNDAFPFAKNIEKNEFEQREGGYTFINPLLECEFAKNSDLTKINTIENAVEKTIGNNQDIETSVYYRDLVNGNWYGYAENTQFAPQSLLKLPTVIAYFKLAEENPAILNEMIDYEEKIDSNLPEDLVLQLGKKYSVEELIERTLQLSDNASFNLLVAAIQPKFIQQVHEDLNIPYPNAETPDDFITVRQYSSIFRVLYNSSYLSRKYSEKLLAILTQSDYKDGLVSSVTDDIAVAHKFGLKNPTAENKRTQLHDCGIIYIPDNPYLLCIMTKGEDQIKQSDLISRISHSVFQAVENKSLNK